MLNRYTNRLLQTSETMCASLIHLHSFVYKISTHIYGFNVQGNLVEWLNSMVRDQNLIQLVDPKLAEKPNKKELKRIILIALRCVDEDAENRPKMGDIIHMLEPRDLLLSDVSTSNISSTIFSAAIEVSLFTFVFCSHRLAIDFYLNTGTCNKNRGFSSQS